MSRAENYSSDEKELLVALVRDHKNVIECKNTDGVTIKMKNTAWMEIAAQFNGSFPTQRDSKKLKDLWHNMKQRTKKKCSERRRYRGMTGGAPPPSPEDPLIEKTYGEQIIHRPLQPSLFLNLFHICI